MTDIKPSTEIGPTEARDMLREYARLDRADTYNPTMRSASRLYMHEERLITLICAGSRALPEVTK